MSNTLEIDLASLGLVDFLVILSSVLLIILSCLHEYFGHKTYGKGSSMGIFQRHADWIPEGAKQRTLLGVFYMISFPWAQSQLLIILILLIGNPLGIWLGVIALVSVLPQVFLLLGFVSWNKLAIAISSFHGMVLVLWIFTNLL